MRVPVLFVIYESNKQWKKQINNLTGDPMLLFVWLLFFGLSFFFFFNKDLYFMVFCVCWLPLSFGGTAASD